MKEQIDKLDFKKKENGFSSRDTARRMKIQITERQKSFAEQTSYKGFISRTHKEFQNSNKKINYLIKKTEILTKTSLKKV